MANSLMTTYYIIRYYYTPRYYAKQIICIKPLLNLNHSYGVRYCFNPHFSDEAQRGKIPHPTRYC